jgi:RNA polymerase sigma-70 factor (ECF subfamily)
MTARARADLDLIEKYLAGDTTAFEELMRAHEDRVFSVCLRMLREREAALDAVQETFVTVFRKVDRFKGDAAFGTWLYRVAMNTCYDQLRRRKRHDTVPLPDNADPPEIGTDDALAAIELRPDLEAALDAIPVDFRAAVILSDIEGIPLVEIADLLEIPIGTVKSRVFRGRRLLAQILGNLSPTTAPPRDEAP